MINIKEKEFSNYQPKFTGKGVKIALLEYYASNLFPTINISNKLNMFCGDSSGLFNYDPPGDNHVFQTGATIRDMLPDAVIDFFPQTDAGLREAIAGNYDLLSFSGRQCMADNALEKDLAKKTFICVSAGNEGAQGEGAGYPDVPARQEWWNAVGAIHLENGVPGMAVYSSYGYNMIKMVSFSNMQYREGSFKVQGTSFACPFAVGLLGQFTQAFYEKFGTKPVPKEYLHFISKNTVDVVPGTIQDGLGRLVLPNFDTYDFGILFKDKSMSANVNGTISPLEAPSRVFRKGDTVTPDLIDRTYLPAAALRYLGMAVNYHADVNGTIVSK